MSNVGLIQLLSMIMT